MAIQNLAEIYEEFVNSKTLTVQEALESHMIDWTLPLVPWILTYLLFIEILSSGLKRYPRNPFLYTYLKWHSEFLSSQETDLNEFFPMLKATIIS